MRHLSTEAKEALVAKVLSGRESIRVLAAANGVGYSSLQRWVSQVRKTGSTAGRSDSRPALGESPIRPLEHLLATVGLDENAVGAYCREQGIHSFQLEAWQEQLMKDDGNKQEAGALRKEIHALRNENKTLKKDLYRKDKALAETTALLILKKKADLIWGEHEAD